MLCLAGAGGGHVRQLLDLEPLWRDHDYFFVTEDTSLGRSIARDHPVAFVPHFALGQARLGSPFKMLVAAARSIFSSFRAVAARRPDIIITTGAGSQLFVVLWGRLFGAKVLLVDSFARFDHPSAFAKKAGRFAHVRIAQSARSAEHWPGALVFDPFRIDDTPATDKEPLLFATVGATLPFERLTRLIIDAKRAGLIPERIVLQTGELPAPLPPVEGIEMHETLEFSEIQALLRRADIVVCHGGTGSIITALRQACRTIVVPRSFDLGESYDHHQSEITDTFVERGLAVQASNDADFAQALQQARARKPVRATTDPAALIAYLRDFISRWRR